MPKLETTVAPTPLVDLELQQEIDAEISAYQDATAEAKFYIEMASGHKAKVWDILKRKGEKSIKYNEFTVTEVRGDSTKLLVLELKKQGVTDAQIKAATKTSPKKPYVLITEGDQLTEDQS